MNLSIARMRMNQTQIIDFLIIPSLIFITCYLIFLTSGLLSSGLRLFINDHLFVAINHDLKEIGFISTIHKWLLFGRSIGRFTPFIYINLTVLTLFFGINPTLWFSHAFLLTSLMGCFLFLFARFLKMPILIALIFSGLVLIGPQAIVWAQPSNTQLPGMFLLSAALLFAGISAKVEQHKTVFDIIFIFVVLLMSLSKESFIIFIPALVLIKVWSYQQLKQVSLRESIIRNSVVTAALLCIALLEIFYIVFVISVRGMGYAGIDEDTLKPYKILSASSTLLSSTHFEIFVLSLILVLLIVLWKRQSFIDLIKQLAPVFVIFLLTVVPQIILYTKSGFILYTKSGSNGQYLVPAVVGTALLTSFTLLLLNFRSRFLSMIMVGLTIFVICTESFTVWNVYNQMSRDSKIINNLFQAIHSCTPNNEPILIVGNPRVRVEAYTAMKSTLNYALQRDNLIIATYGLEKTNFFSNTLQQDERAFLFIDPKYIPYLYGNRTILNFQDKSKIKAIVIFDSLEDDFLKTSSDWFKLENFQRSSFPNTIAPATLYCKQ
jgi:hypothetical protein